MFWGVGEEKKKWLRILGSVFLIFKDEFESDY